MKFKAETDGAIDGPYYLIYEDKEVFVKDHNIDNPILKEFLKCDDMSSITVDFGDEWFKYSRMYGE